MAEAKNPADKKVKNPLAEAQNWDQRVKTELEVRAILISDVDWCICYQSLVYKQGGKRGVQIFICNCFR